MPQTDAKELLYASINRIGKAQLKMELNADIKSSKQFIAKIVTECFTEIEQADHSTKGDLCEALLHFFLSALSIPSERKIKMGNIEIDIVIPSAKQLKSNPARAIVILISREQGNTFLRPNIELVQPHRSNIWVVSDKPLETPYRLFGSWDDALSFSNIVVEIQRFLVENGIRGLKLVSD